MADVPKKILALARAVREAGGRALLVGGCVRDALLGLRPKDWDVEVYGVEPARLRALLENFGRVDAVGEAFTVYKLGHDLDVSLPRRERKAGRGHRGFVIEGDPAMPVAEAARRRDFTINAVLCDPLTGEHLDPFGGRDDLAKKLLRAVAPDTFVEDSLRVLRAAQLAARFELDIDPATVELCRSIDLTDLPAERVWGELEKILLQAERPSVGLHWLRNLGVVSQLFPELGTLINCPQESEWHPEGWELKELPFQPPGTGTTQAASTDRRLTLREFCASAAAGAAMIPTGDRTMNAQPAETAAVNPSPADNAGAVDLGTPPLPRPAVTAEAAGLVWSFGSPAAFAGEVGRIVFQIPLSRMCSVVRGAVNDFEVLKRIVHPVAVFVVNVLSGFKSPTELQFHEQAMEADSTVAAEPTGVHVPVVIADARAAAVDDNVLVYFDLAFVGDGEAFHAAKSVTRGRRFQARLGDVWVHTEQAIDRAREQIDDLPYAKRVAVMLAALCHDFGKPSTTEFVEGRIRSRGHDEAGVEPTISFLDRLKIFTLDGYDVRAQVVELVRHHLKPGEFYRKRDEISDGAFRRLARRCELELLYRVARADSLGRNAPWVPPERWYGAEAQEWFIARARALAVGERAPAPLLMGRHLLELGLRPGPRVGQLTRAVYEMQLDGRVTTLAEALDAARALLDERGRGNSPAVLTD